MTYWLLNAAFLGIVALVAVAAVLARRGTPRRVRWRAIGLAAIPMLILTAIFDNLMIGVGLVAYSGERISGVMIGIAPLEDFTYTVAALVLLPSLWALLPARAERPAA
ncbi:lycopene cyclase domain-containing protein [Homoserinibacter sp. YIM 151385]|uniref:lycopene cyclase domain-containing protein n=1 Tax=Homoserinibacter sp. YIM 151385 TaxID=2985506 RepID=UPI0022F0FF31|nr:lycopene cyclase domain-containing protein [Homoserinibacter sp. YIM 151385]WBU37302.1 lycopene cyclase domain-containing protein [Homoserinibacter sp. YIM 151385]